MYILLYTGQASSSVVCFYNNIILMFFITNVDVVRNSRDNVMTLFMYTHCTVCVMHQKLHVHMTSKVYVRYSSKYARNIFCHVRGYTFM